MNLPMNETNGTLSAQMADPRGKINESYDTVTSQTKIQPLQKQ